MKKIILFAAILFAGVSVVKAQGLPKEAQTELTLKLGRIQAIIVNHSAVTLDYITIEDYNKGVKSSQADHLTVYSAGGFKVTVGANDLEETGGKKVLANTINVTPSAGSKALGTEVFTAKKIGSIATPETIISNTKGGLLLKYNIEYEGDNAYKYMDNLLDSEESTEYTASVIYTISPN